MPKVRKVARRKKFRHVVNRKKVNKRKKRMPAISCTAIKEVWDDKSSANVNMNQMGLSTDPNVTLGVPRAKEALASVRLMKETKKSLKQKETPKIEEFPKLAVAEQLERESKERKRKSLRLSTMQVDKLAYFIEKFGNDYKAMTRDRMNFDQHTWKQLRAQIKKFMECKEQWDEYWKSRDMDPPDRSIVVEEMEDSD
ncbi:nucleolar protein 16 [Neocloeon triangulifer]|uniref:nucleolar protein 16 n=1 Tax=Neocloeon triangulifer TaxID=2078957 RepID=UPI00286EED27|nr:nucleolar protein 16 [Neocloeon triangulifer]